MGALKVRVGGSWVTIPGYGNTVGVPLGGAAGDFLIKNSATDGDGRWGTTNTKLKLTPGNVVGLDTNNPALQIGEEVSQNLVAYWSGLMSRNNGAAAVLRLNYYGGSVIAGGGDTSQYPKAFQIGDSAHATSRRATLSLGSGWEFDADTAGNGTKDFGLLQMTNARWSIRVSADGQTYTIGPSSGTVRIGLGVTGASPQIYTDQNYIVMAAKTNAYIDGDTVYLRDVVGNVRLSVVNNGFTYFNGTNSRIGDNGEFRIIAGSTTITVQSDNFQVLNTASSTWKFRHNGTVFESWGQMTNHGDFYVDNDIYTGTNYWIRVRGPYGIYWQDYGTGWQGNSSGWIQTYSNGNIMMNSGIIAMTANAGKLRFYSRDDDNHRLHYTNGVPSGSGEASNGPVLTGYTSVWLLNVAYGKSFYLASNGNVFINSGSTYNVFSSADFKDEIETIDPEDALETVLRWRPVRYRWKRDLKTPHEFGEGFIAEEMQKVTPEVCNILDEMPVPDCEETDPYYAEARAAHAENLRRTGKLGVANAIAYDMLTTRLAGAVQALSTRIAMLEAELEARKN